jgi:PAS domain S-box-containing protein
LSDNSTTWAFIFTVATRTDAAGERRKHLKADTMRKSLFIILMLMSILGAASSVSARNSLYDSVRVSIADRPVKQRFEVMEQFADSLLNQSPYDAIPFTREAIRLAHERGDKTEEGYLLNSLAKIYINLGEITTSGECARAALVLNLEVKHMYEVARTYGITAVTYNYMGLYTNAMEYSLKALNIYEELGKKKQTAIMMNSIGTIYLRISEYEKAKEFFDRSRVMLQKKDTTIFLLLLFNNIASIHYRQGQPDSALVELAPLLAAARRRHDKGAEAYTLYNIGSAYGVKKEYDRAVEYLRQAREASSIAHEARGGAEASLGIAETYSKSGEYRKALAALNEAIPYCRQSKTYDFLREALDLQRKAFDSLGDVRHAYASSLAYTRLTDSVFTIAEKFGVANAVFSSDIALKESEISRLRQNAVLGEILIEKKQNQIYALAAVMSIVVIAVIALVFMYRKANRLHKVEIAQKEKIETLYHQLSKLVTDRKLADEQARESQQKFQAVWEKSVDGMRLTDKDGVVLMVNEAFCRMVGSRRDELVGRSLAVIYDGKMHEQVVRVYRERFAAHEVESYFERELFFRDGRALWFEVTNTYIEIEEQPTLLLGIFRDVTHRKKLEHQLVQSQKLESIGTLAGGIAHDFNNLLAMILGSAEMLQRRISAQPELQKYVDRIVEASVRGTSISRQLLIFSRPDQSQLKPISLSQTITGLQEMLKHFLPKSILIKTVIADGNDMIMGDAGQIQQALLNLAINAGDAMINHGTLTIREYPADPAVIRDRFPDADACAYIALSVADTGIGMDDAVKQKIFDPFFTTKERTKGTGLGLSNVHGIVKNHHGLIDVDSAPGRGTTFTVYFPIVTMSMPRQAEPASPKNTAVQETILLVDDEPLIRETLHEYLVARGYTVHAASGGREALELFRTHHAAIDLVVTDLGMPEMGGEELYGHLRDIDPTIKVIVSSGYLDGTTKTDLLSLGVKDVLTKPVMIHDLQSAITTVLNHS